MQVTIQGKAIPSPDREVLISVTGDPDELPALCDTLIRVMEQLHTDERGKTIVSIPALQRASFSAPTARRAPHPGYQIIKDLVGRNAAAGEDGTKPYMSAARFAPGYDVDNQGYIPIDEEDLQP